MKHRSIALTDEMRKRLNWAACYRDMSSQALIELAIDRELDRCATEDGGLAALFAAIQSGQL
jgi:predicted transcriptional regulator